MREKLFKNIPNILSILRLSSVIPLLLLAYFNFKSAFLLLLLFSGISDVLDGHIARKFNLESKFGRKIDALADITFLPTVFLSIAIFNITGYESYISTIFSFFLLLVAYYFFCIIKFKKFFTIHLWSSKATFIPTILLLLYILVSGSFPKTIINVYLFLCYFAFFEVFLVLYLSKQIPPKNIHSVLELINKKDDKIIL